MIKVPIFVNTEIIRSYPRRIPRTGEIIMNETDMDVKRKSLYLKGLRLKLDENNPEHKHRRADRAVGEIFEGFRTSAAWKILNRMSYG